MTPPNEHTSEGGRDDRGVPYHAESALSSAQVLKVEGADREFRKSEDGIHFSTDGPAPRRYDGDTAARVRVPVFVRSEKSDALVGDGVPGFRQARRTSTAPSVACNSLRQKPGEQLLCCSHALHSWHSPLCGCRSCDSDGLALTGPQCHLCCGLCERHCSATAGTL